MKLSKSKIDQIKALCSEVSEDDGIHPRELAKKERKKRIDYKSLQLSKQAERALHLEWSGVFATSVLADLKIHSVEPEPQSQRLIVTIILDSACSCSEKEVLVKLTNERGHLRSIIARAIHRKKVPELAFRIIAPSDIVPSDIVPSDIVPSDIVPSDIVPSDIV